ncbi:hypothetical protein [Bacillus sp. JJ722]|uniref:hypothetical protein n=1 Tax=Bacillus sp. JJ722 TaxID=3122973 RepID=UPI002FFEF375
MIKAGIALLIVGILMTVVTTNMIEEYPFMKYVQIGGFFLGVIGLFMMETNRRKRFKKKS